MTRIEISDLSVSYRMGKKSVLAIDRLNTVFEDGINVIVGYSGCGKTTLLRSILGLLPYDGKITLNGDDLFEIPVKERCFSYISQEYVLYPHMTVFDNIAFPLKNMAAPREEILRRVNRLAELTDLTPCLSRKPRHISGGQQQRVALARAFVKNPTICLMDEPFSNTDAQARYRARQQIRAMAEESGCMILYVTHDFSEAMALADRLFVMDEGQIVVSGSPAEVYAADHEVVRYLKEGSETEWK